VSSTCRGGEKGYYFDRSMRRKKPLLKTINTAFLLRNLKNLSFEEKVVFGSHGVTILFCLFPWMSFAPIYGDLESYNAFQGPARLMGWLIFLMSLMAIASFVDQIMQKKWLQFSISNNTILGFLAFQEIILLVCSWSVLVYFGGNFEESQARFALFGCLFAQVLALVFTYLEVQKDKKQAVQDFFQPATNSEKPTHSSENK